MDLVFYTDAIKILALFFSLVGAVLIGYGGVAAAIKVVLREVFRRPYSYNLIRREFTSKIVFGLEFFIASDVLTTLIAPTQEEIILLAVVVVIRTILGYFLARETVEYQLEP
ncbi:MAG: DUF1622 domain-containing protein [Methanomicrobiales archaeon]|jgi:uncharacterized membrane protein|nr:DUF1622 domain-containing protein [Burkholderiaceae bacterium]NLH26027.1 DUF1622 domain-containing protein [Methanomicrobiales archaeon]HNB03748.1 DUF1622 domain-containing protein [Methanoregulaceae archaeon]HNI42306.1 DUF1622 domain-containing protein [Methanoregulaceae archaeon]HNJ80954.1 DUF1622 domain-containing protein [Methanoregulaceae archaeon]